MTTKTRKYFGTDGIRGRFGDPKVSPEFVLKLGWAAGRVFSQGGHSKVLIGKDTRISGYVLEAALEAGFTAAGVDVELVGPMPTPAIAYLTRTFRVQAGVVISASHNLYQDNGIKFFNSDGEKLSDEIELQIEEELEKTMQVVESHALGKASRINDAKGRYIEFCKSTADFQMSLAGMRIIVDCANGATYHIAPDVFRELGAEIITIGNQPNGVNINQDCGATSLNLLKEVVVAENADLGIALDGDGDRVMMVDHTGEVVDGDELLYIIVKREQDSGCLKGGVAGTVMTNLAIEKAFAADGVPFIRTPVGDRYVLAELKKRQWLFGGEGSGHIVCLDKTTTGDGIVSALQVLMAMRSLGKTLFDLRQHINKYPQILINVSVSKKIDPMSVAAVTNAVAESQERLSDKGRILLRASGTEAVIRVMVEGEDLVQVEKEAKYLAGIVEANI